MSTSFFAVPRRCAVAFLLAAAVFGQAPSEIVARIADEASEEKSRVMDHLSELCLGIGPRLTGSQNLVKASEWAAQKFLSYGLSVRLDKWTDVETGFDRGVHTGFAFWSDATESRPAEGGRRRRGFGGDGQRGRRLVFGTDAWTGGTDGLKTGPALRVPEDESGLSALRESARGAWLVRVAGSLDSRSKALTDFIADTGAYGVVSASPGGELIRTGGRLRTKWEERSPLVRINLHGDDHKHVADLLTAGREVVLAFDVQNRYRQGPVPAYNVVAELRGAEKPEELVIVGGHLDSWDGAMGTTDNGTGVATTIEAARLLTAAGARPKRTIRFMLWSGEEQGLLGSRDYIKRHPEENDRISAVLVHDGGTNYVSGIQATAAMADDMARVFRPATTLNPAFPFAVHPVDRLPSGIGSDHDSYVSVGVPGFFWSQSGRANYTYTHHTQNDVLAAAVPEYQRHTSAVVAIGALGIADLPEKLSRVAPERVVAERPNVLRGRVLGFNSASDAPVIETLSEDGLAVRHGFKVGDRIVKIDGKPVKTLEEFRSELQLGEPLKKFGVLRADSEIEIAVDFSGR